MAEPTPTKPTEAPKQITAPQSHPPEDKKFEAPKADIKVPEVKDKEPTTSVVIKAIKHMEEIKAYVLKFAGKQGYNPYTYLKESGIDEAFDILRLDNISETSRIVAENILKLPIVEPVIKPMKPTGLREFLAKQQAEIEAKKLAKKV